MLRNVVRQSRRGQGRREVREQSRGRHDSVPATADVVEELAWHRALVEHVNELSEPYRTTIVHRFLHELSPKEIARQQAVPVKTVHTRIDRGLDHLRRSLDRDHERSSWLPAVSALVLPTGKETHAGSILLGELAMGMKVKWAAVALFVVAGGAYWATTRSDGAHPPQMSIAEQRLGQDLAAGSGSPPSASGGARGAHLHHLSAAFPHRAARGRPGVPTASASRRNS